MNHHHDSDDDSQEYTQDEYHCDMICDLLKLINGSKTLSASRYGTRDYDLMTNSRLRMLIEITRMEIQDEAIKNQKDDGYTDDTYEDEHEELIDELFEIFQNATCRLKANQYSGCYLDSLTNDELITLIRESRDEINKASIAYDIKKQ